MIYITNSRIGSCISRELDGTLSDQAVQSVGISVEGQPGDLFVGALDGCDLNQLCRWEREALNRGMRFLPVHVQGGEAIIGPEIRRGRSGCLRCWAARYFGARKNARCFADQGDLASLQPQTDPWLTPLSASILGSLISQRIVQSIERNEQSESGETAWSAYYFQLRTMSGREWLVLADSSCPICGCLPYDSPARAHINIEDGEKHSEETDRLRTLSDLDFVADAYVGYRSNIVSQEFINWNFDIGAVVSVAVTLADTRRPEPCSGFCSNYKDAHTVAVLEGLERYSGVRPRGIRGFMRSSIRSLKENSVIDPRLFGLHSPHEYDDFPELLTPFSEELEMDFAWAFSFARKQSVLVPKQLAYYSLGSPGEPSFLIEGSIGCVLGSSIEECILHGIFEVVERDAFLLTWYAQLDPPCLDLRECTDPEVRYRYRHLCKEGFDVFAFDITTDHGIPAVWVLARRCEWKMPFAFCCGAAHLRPEVAIKKALRELTAAYCRSRIELQDDNIRQRALSLAQDPGKVRTMEDHTLLYCVPESGRHLEFLVASNKQTSLRQMEDQIRPLWSRSLGKELQGVIDRILDSGSDVIVAKQTSPELAAHGLHTCKTLISDAIPMTWGQHRRLEGLQRLEAALYDKALQDGGLRVGPNPAPHPYP